MPHLTVFRLVWPDWAHDETGLDQSLMVVVLMVMAHIPSVTMEVAEDPIEE